MSNRIMQKICANVKTYFPNSCINLCIFGRSQIQQFSSLWIFCYFRFFFCLRIAVSFPAVWKKINIALRENWLVWKWKTFKIWVHFGVKDRGNCGSVFEESPFTISLGSWNVNFALAQTSIFWNQFPICGVVIFIKIYFLEITSSFCKL